MSSVSLDSIEEMQKKKLRLTKNLNFLKEFGNKKETAEGFAEVSSVSTVSFTALEEANDVRNQLFKNLSYLKEHENLVAKNFSFFGEVEEVSKKFQEDLKSVLFVENEDENKIENINRIKKEPKHKKKKRKSKTETNNDKRESKTEPAKDERQEISEKPSKKNFFSFKPFNKKINTDTKIQKSLKEKKVDEEKKIEKEEEKKEESEGSSYEDSIDSVDMDIFEPFDQASNISSTDLNEEKKQDEALMVKMKTVLWNVAYKKMKKDDWLKLAKNWNFNEAHIKAIQFDCSKGLIIFCTIFFGFFINSVCFVYIKIRNFFLKK